MKNINIKVLLLLLGLSIIIFFGPKLLQRNSTPTVSDSEQATTKDNLSSDSSTQKIPPLDENKETEDQLSLEEEATLPNIPEGKVGIKVQQPIMIQETTKTDSTSYHELILNLSTDEVKLHLIDFVEKETIQDALNHLYMYEYNFTPNTIGLSSQANSYYVLCNKLNQLPSDYAPEDLVIPDLPATTDQDVDKRYVRETMAHALEDFFAAAKENGYQLYCLSGYRSYNTQDIVYNNFVQSKGQEDADKISARPSHSEHQTGLAMDVTTEAMEFRLMQALGETEEGIYIAEHAHEFGLTVRYPVDESAITGYSYEPWHLRYVGVELATFLYENDVTLEEFYYTVQSQMFLIESTDSLIPN